MTHRLLLAGLAPCLALFPAAAAAQAVVEEVEEGGIFVPELLESEEEAPELEEAETAPRRPLVITLPCLLYTSPSPRD